MDDRILHGDLLPTTSAPPLPNQPRDGKTPEQARYELVKDYLLGSSAIVIGTRENGKVKPDQIITIDQNPKDQAIVLGVKSGDTLDDKQLFTVRFAESTNVTEGLRPIVVQSDKKESAEGTTFEKTFKKTGFLKEQQYAAVKAMLPDTEEGKYIAEHMDEGYVSYIVRDEKNGLDIGTAKNVQLESIHQENQVGTITILRYTKPDGSKGFVCFGNSFADRDTSQKTTEHMTVTRVDGINDKIEQKLKIILPTNIDLAAAAELVASTKADELLELAKSRKNEQQIQDYITQGISNADPAERAKTAKVIQKIIEKKDPDGNGDDVEKAKLNIIAITADKLVSPLPNDQQLLNRENFQRLLQENPALLTSVVALITESKIGTSITEENRYAAARLIKNISTGPSGSFLILESCLDDFVSFIGENPKDESPVESRKPYERTKRDLLSTLKHVTLVDGTTRLELAKKLATDPNFEEMLHSVLTKQPSESLERDIYDQHFTAVEIIAELASTVFVGPISKEAPRLVFDKLKSSPRLMGAIKSAMRNTDDRPTQGRTFDIFLNLTFSRELGIPPEMTSMLAHDPELAELIIHAVGAGVENEKLRRRSLKIIDSLAQSEESRDVLKTVLEEGQFVDQAKKYLELSRSEAYFANLDIAADVKRDEKRSLINIVRTLDLREAIGPIDVQLLRDIKKDQAENNPYGDFYVGTNSGKVVTDGNSTRILYIDKNRGVVGVRAERDNRSTGHIDIHESGGLSANGDLFVATVVGDEKQYISIGGYTDRMGRVFTTPETEVKIDAERPNNVYVSRIPTDPSLLSADNGVANGYRILRDEDETYVIARSVNKKGENVHSAYKLIYVHELNKEPVQKLVFIAAQDGEDPKKFIATMQQKMGQYSDLNSLLPGTLEDLKQPEVDPEVSEIMHDLADFKNIDKIKAKFIERIKFADTDHPTKEEEQRLEQTGSLIKKLLECNVPDLNDEQKITAINNFTALFQQLIPEARYIPFAQKDTFGRELNMLMDTGELAPWLIERVSDQKIGSEHEESVRQFLIPFGFKLYRMHGMEETHDFINSVSQFIESEPVGIDYSSENYRQYLLAQSDALALVQDSLRDDYASSIPRNPLKGREGILGGLVAGYKKNWERHLTPEEAKKIRERVANTFWSFCETTDGNTTDTFSTFRFNFTYDKFGLQECVASGLTDFQNGDAPLSFSLVLADISKQIQYTLAATETRPEQILNKPEFIGPIADLIGYNSTHLQETTSQQRVIEYARANAIRAVSNFSKLQPTFVEQEKMQTALANCSTYRKTPEFDEVRVAIGRFQLGDGEINNMLTETNALLAGLERGHSTKAQIAELGARLFAVDRLKENAAKLFNKPVDTLTQADYTSMDSATAEELLTAYIGLPVTIKPADQTVQITIRDDGKPENGVARIRGVDLSLLQEPVPDETKTPLWNLIIENNSDNPLHERLAVIQVTLPSISQTNNINLDKCVIQHIGKAQGQLSLYSTTIGTIDVADDVFSQNSGFDRIGSAGKIRLKGDKTTLGDGYENVEFGEVGQVEDLKLQEGAKIIVGKVNKLVLEKKAWEEDKENAVLIIDSLKPQTIQMVQGDAVFHIDRDLDQYKQQLIRAGEAFSITTMDEMAEHLDALPDREGMFVAFNLNEKKYAAIKVSAYNAEKRNFSDSAYALVEVVEKNGESYLFLRSRLVTEGETETPAQKVMKLLTKRVYELPDKTDLAKRIGSHDVLDRKIGRQEITEETLAGLAAEETETLLGLYLKAKVQITQTNEKVTVTLSGYDDTQVQGTYLNLVDPQLSAAETSSPRWDLVIGNLSEKEPMNILNPVASSITTIVSTVQLTKGSVEHIMDASESDLYVRGGRVGVIDKANTISVLDGAFDRIGLAENISIWGDQTSTQPTQTGTIEYGEVEQVDYLTLNEGAKVVVGAVKLVTLNRGQKDGSKNAVLIANAQTPRILADIAGLDSVHHVSKDLNILKTDILKRIESTDLKTGKPTDIEPDLLPKKEGDSVIVKDGEKTYALIRTSVYNDDRKSFSSSGYATVEIVEKNGKPYLFLRSDQTIQIPAEQPPKKTAEDRPDEAALKKLFTGQTLKNHYDTVDLPDHTQKEILVIDTPEGEQKDAPLVISSYEQYAWLQNNPDIRVARPIYLSARTIQPQTIGLDSITLLEGGHITIAENVTVHFKDVVGKGRLIVENRLWSVGDFKNATLNIYSDRSVDVSNAVFSELELKPSSVVTVSYSRINSNLVVEQGAVLQLLSVTLAYKTNQPDSPLVNLLDGKIICLGFLSDGIDDLPEIERPVILEGPKKINDFKELATMIRSEKEATAYLADIGRRIYEKWIPGPGRALQTINEIAAQMKTFTGKEPADIGVSDFENLNKEQIEKLLALCLSSRDANHEFRSVKIEPNRVIVSLKIPQESVDANYKEQLGIPEPTAYIFGGNDEKTTIELRGNNTRFVIGGAIHNLETTGDQNSEIYVHSSGKVTNLKDQQEGKYLVVDLSGSIQNLNAAKSVILESVYNTEGPTLGTAGTIGELTEKENSSKKTSPRVGYVQKVTDMQLLDVNVVIGEVENLSINGTGNVLIWNKIENNGLAPHSTHLGKEAGLMLFSGGDNELSIDPTRQVTVKNSENEPVYTYDINGLRNVLCRVRLFNHNNLGSNSIYDRIGYVHFDSSGFLETVTLPPEGSYALAISADNRIELVEIVSDKEKLLVDAVLENMKTTPQLRLQVAKILGARPDEVDAYIERAQTEPGVAKVLFKQIAIVGMANEFSSNNHLTIAQIVAPNTKRSGIVVLSNTYINTLADQTVFITGKANCIVDSLHANTGAIVLQDSSRTTIEKVLTDETSRSNNAAIRMKDGAVSTIRSFQQGKIELGTGSPVLYLESTTNNVTIQTSDDSGGTVILGHNAYEAQEFSSREKKNIFILPNYLSLDRLAYNELTANTMPVVDLSWPFPQAFIKDGRKLVFLTLPHSTDPNRKEFSLFEVQPGQHGEQLELICAAESQQSFNMRLYDARLPQPDRPPVNENPDIKKLVNAAVHVLPGDMSEESRSGLADSISKSFFDMRADRPKLTVSEFEKAAGKVMRNYDKIRQFRKRIESPDAVDSVYFIFPQFSRDEDMKRFSKIKSILEKIQPEQYKSLSKNERDRKINYLAASLTPTVIDPVAEFESRELIIKLKLIAALDSVEIIDLPPQT